MDFTMWLRKLREWLLARKVWNWDRISFLMQNLLTPEQLDWSIHESAIKRSIQVWPISSADIKVGKAAGLDSLTAEHLKYSHPALATVLAKLFNIMLIFGCLPFAFGRSYTVPLSKGGHAIGKSLTVEDFRGISISPMLSKIFDIVYLIYMHLSLQPATINLD